MEAATAQTPEGLAQGAGVARDVADAFERRPRLLCDSQRHVVGDWPGERPLLVACEPRRGDQLGETGDWLETHACEGASMGETASQLKSAETSRSDNRGNRQRVIAAG